MLKNYLTKFSGKVSIYLKRRDFKIKVGFIGFGEVASTLTIELLINGAEVFTCVEGRSDFSRNLAQEKNVNTVPTNEALAQKVDIILSAVTPAAAIDAAASIGTNFKGTYVDINNVSPEAVKSALQHIKQSKVVDAAIIGSVNRKKVQILASGKDAPEFAQLNDFGLNIKIIGTEIGQASGIKMLRSSYTKGVSALLWETFYAAYKMGVDEELFDVIANTEGPEFKKSAISRMISTAFHASRRQEEMKEVQLALSLSQDPILAKSTERKFHQIAQKLKRLDKKPDTYREAFLLWEKI